MRKFKVTHSSLICSGVDRRSTWVALGLNVVAKGFSTSTVQSEPSSQGSEPNQSTSYRASKWLKGNFSFK